MVEEPTEKDWQKKLTAEQYHIMRQKGTEQAFTGQYWDCHDDGVYLCAACGQPLFTSETKYDSGTGWPSFWEPVSSDAVEYDEDHKLQYKRTEVLCQRCHSHLGHVFDDGPDPSGKRFCINSVALKLRKEEQQKDEEQ